MKRLAIVFLFLSQFVFAGGPFQVAGVSNFQSGLAGTPITWGNGQITYYTDQGDLSPLLPNSAADQFVADTFSRWTSISTASVTATRAGTLNEDVDGSNVKLIQGSLSLPADLATNSGKPLAIIYDADGRVFDALLGTGAGSPDLCDTNSVYSVVDKIGDAAHIVHAMVFLNGNCAKYASDLPVLKYKLVRALGQVLGLDYSQLNDNVVNGIPGPSLEDYAGFPVMHAIPALCNIVGCQSDADQPRMDDRAALSRLYPVTAANASTGKHIFHNSTVRIYGTVRFPAWKGTLGQGMQGVNVVARLIDPVTSRISHRYSASSVSGFLFRGKAGNPITGFFDVLGRRFDSFGSDDPNLEGFYDLSGLEVPAGYDSATYEVSVEAVNPAYVYSNSVGPYKQGQVTPSGTYPTFRVTIPNGGEVAQDIAMQKAANEAADKLEPHSFLFPVALPATGDWTGSISGYGDLDYLYFSARANRSFTFDVIALDETGNATSSKLEPVLGVWTTSDAEDTPRFFESYFNSTATGTTRLQGTAIGNGEYKLGIADARGDGRPDFRYEARFLYADDLAPSRAGVQGGTSIIVSGIGFSNNMQVTVGSAPVTATTLSPNQIRFTSPELPDGTYSLVVRDTLTGAVAQMDNVLRVGAAEAKIVLLSGSNPQVPVGTQAPNPMRVQVVDADSGTAVAGATVLVTTPGSASVAGCTQTPCALTTDQNGAVNVYMIARAEGPSAISAALPSGASVSTTINGIMVPLEITLNNTSVNISAGANATISITATVVANGLAAAGKTVNFLLNSGRATITPVSSVTDADGNASTSLAVTAITSDVNISACVAPDNAPCRTLVIHAVQPANLAIERVDGDQQTIAVGQSFAPVSVRVLDGAANPVTGVPVTFLVDVYKVAGDTVRVQRGEVIVTTRDEPVVLSTSLQSEVSDASGLATLNLSINQNQPVYVAVRAMAGAAELTLNLQSVWSQSLATPVPGSAQGKTTSSRTNRPTHSLSCTKAGCSAASGSSALRQGNKAFSKALSTSADK